jgi:hypothetical protein
MKKPPGIPSGTTTLRRLTTRDEAAPEDFLNVRSGKATLTRARERSRPSPQGGEPRFAVLDAKGGPSLLVDTWPVARAEGHLLSGVAPEQGLLQDVRVYRGVVSRDDQGDLPGEWAQRRGCGCRK